MLFLVTAGHFHYVEHLSAFVSLQGISFRADKNQFASIVLCSYLNQRKILGGENGMGMWFFNQGAVSFDLALFSLRCFFGTLERCRWARYFRLYYYLREYIVIRLDGFDINLLRHSTFQTVLIPINSRKSH